MAFHVPCSYCSCSVTYTVQITKNANSYCIADLETSGVRKFPELEVTSVVIFPPPDWDLKIPIQM